MRVFKIVGFVCLLLVLIGVSAGTGIYFWAVRDLPGFTTITDYNPPLVTTVFTRNDNVLGYFYKEKRFLVPLSEMSPFVGKAFLAAEDSGFYEHEGVDIPGIFRAAVKNVLAGGIVQGGSTITQQVIKSLLLTPERSYARKVKEAILAYRLEKYLTKDEILTIYLNQIYMGSGAYGVEAAAREYFATHASDLTLAQAALLAGLPKAPSRYSPLNHPAKAIKRQHYVLNRLRDLGWISEQAFQEAMETKLVFKSMADPSWQQGAYYLEEVRRRLLDRFGEDVVYNGGLNVHTGMDFAHQLPAETALRNGLRASTKRRGWQGPIKNLKPSEYKDFFGNATFVVDALVPGEWLQVLVESVDKSGARVLFGEHEGFIGVGTMGWARVPDVTKAPEDVPRIRDARKVLHPGDVVWASIATPPKDKGVWQLALEQEPRVQGALVSLDPHTGDVLALVGGYDFFKSQYNRATQASRQPGSGFKPIVYSTALDNGFTPASVVLDAPIVYDDHSTNSTWKPENFEGVFYGPTLLRTALVKSRNLVTIRIAQQLGIKKIIKRAHDLGLEGDFPEDLSVSLGSRPVTPMELCTAFTCFARGGTTVQPRLITRVDDAWGKELYAPEVVPSQAMSPQTAYIITNLLQQVVKYGTGWRARVLKRPVAGKTGTSNNEQDAWFMGFTPYLLTGVYVGFDQVKPMGKYETGSRAASPIWVEYRKAVEDNYPVQDFAQPPGIVMARIDPKTGKLARPGSSNSIFLPFKQGTEPTQTDAAPLPGETSGPSMLDSGADENLLKQIF
ncbi:penicillin-binding protein 1A [Desulfoplanes formicivorans]|uniref:Penicillin-binding protein 1A n=1 Tax=Desulfoplanes formicivorans TaxID=1592317 RepID=A0A194AH68_9BACT|nr:PBP1A family penicillin-binding protein [Desulfoplanes formicivorans]GAU08673.1 penicillin-binding protein [Desulfoplanes formicivorans]